MVAPLNQIIRQIIKLTNLTKPSIVSIGNNSTIHNSLYVVVWDWDSTNHHYRPLTCWTWALKEGVKEWLCTDVGGQKTSGMDKKESLPVWIKTNIAVHKKQVIECEPRWWPELGYFGVPSFHPSIRPPFPTYCTPWIRVSCQRNGFHL